METGVLSEILNNIKQEATEKRDRPYVIAIEGRCAAGKTTLAGQLAEKLGCSVIHMDHFFLRPEQRTKERMGKPGGNVDYERFREEVILPLQRGSDFTYRIFDCHRMDFHGVAEVKQKDFLIVEGAYCCQSEFFPYWDMTVFLDVAKEEQIRRIQKRNGKEQLQQFIERWIPMEERYFAAFDVKENCEFNLGEREICE